MRLWKKIMRKKSGKKKGQESLNLLNKKWKKPKTEIKNEASFFLNSPLFSTFESIPCLSTLTILQNSFVELYVK